MITSPNPMGKWTSRQTVASTDMASTVKRPATTEALAKAKKRPFEARSSLRNRPTVPGLAGLHIVDVPAPAGLTSAALVARRAASEETSW